MIDDGPICEPLGEEEIVEMGVAEDHEQHGCTRPRSPDYR